MWSGEETDKDSNDYKCTSRSLDGRSESKETGMGKRKTEALQCSKTERTLLC